MTIGEEDGFGEVEKAMLRAYDRVRRLRDHDEMLRATGLDRTEDDELAEAEAELRARRRDVDAIVWGRDTIGVCAGSA